MFITLHIDTKRELNKIKEISERFNKEEQSLVMCMKPVKKEINRLVDNLPWPPEPQNLVPEKFFIPYQLDLMLHSLLENDQGVLQPKGKSLKVSFVVYAVTNSPKAPKHQKHQKVFYFALIKSLTNNTEIINVINKLGHGVSYAVLMETHTENAYRILERQLQNSFILPLDCRCIFAFNFPCLMNPSALLTYIFKLHKRYLFTPSHKFKLY